MRQLTRNDLTQIHELSTALHAMQTVAIPKAERDAVNLTIRRRLVALLDPADRPVPATPIKAKPAPKARA